MQIFDDGIAEMGMKAEMSVIPTSRHLWMMSTDGRLRDNAHLSWQMDCSNERLIAVDFGID
jgi:hypothetical protein